MDSSHPERTTSESLGGSDKTVAQELGISASSLANACRKYNIPLPSAGHWTKVEVGHKITPTTLSLNRRLRIVIHIRERLSPELAASC